MQESLLEAYNDGSVKEILGDYEANFKNKTDLQSLTNDRI